MSNGLIDTAIENVFLSGKSMGQEAQIKRLKTANAALVKAAKAAKRLICSEHCGGGYHDRECSGLTDAIAKAEGD